MPILETVDITRFRDELQAVETEIKKRETTLTSTVKKANETIDKTINDTAIELVTIEFLKDTYGDRFDAYVGTKEKFIVKEMSRGAKLDAIAHYKNSREAEEFKKQLDKNSTQRDSSKEEYVQTAQSIVDAYKQIVEQIKQKVERLVAEKQRIQEVIQSAERRRMRASYDEAEIQSEQIQEIIDENEPHLAQINAWLTELNELLAEKDTIIDQKIKGIDKALKAQGLYREKPEGMQDQQEESEDTPTENSNGVNQNGTALKPMSEKAALKAEATRMLKIFNGSDPVAKEKLIRQYGHNQIISICEHLGPIQKRQLRAKLQTMVNEVDAQGDIEFGGITIDKDNLKGTDKKELSANEIKEIDKELRDFIQNYGTKSVEERLEFEKKLLYIRAAFALRATQHFSGIRRFFKALKVNDDPYESINSSLSTLGAMNAAESEQVIDRSRMFRKSIGEPELAPVYQNTTIEHTRNADPLGRTGGTNYR